MAHRNDISPVLGSDPVDLTRKCKDKAECSAMRKSSSCNDEVMAVAISALKEGVRENEVASLVNREYLLRGADCEGVQLVCFGANGADLHHAADATKLKPGDSVILDLFTPIDHYWCDMTLTVFYQEVSEKQREVYELVRRANEAAIEEIRPGIPLSHIDHAARSIIEQGDMAPPQIGPWLRTGLS